MAIDDGAMSAESLLMLILDDDGATSAELLLLMLIFIFTIHLELVSFVMRPRYKLCLRIYAVII